MSLEFSLVRLQQAELVRRIEPSAFGDAGEFTFKHALVQDTAYASLLKHERKRLHFAIGRGLEAAHGDRIDQVAGELAHHFSKAGDAEKTYVYADRAGDSAARIFAFPEADGYYRQALEGLALLPDGPLSRRRRADTVVKLVGVSLRSQGPEPSLELLRAAEAGLVALGHDPQDRERLARLHFWMGDAYSHLNRQREAIAYLQRVLDATREGITDETLLAIPANVIGRALVAQGRFSEAEPLLAQAAPLLEKSSNWYEWVLAVGFLGFARAAQGDTEGGLAETTRAFTRARELETPFGVGDSRIFASFIHMERGDYGAMLEQANEALRAAQLHDDQLLLFLSSNVRGWAHSRLGEFLQAEQDFAAAHAVAARVGGQMFFADLFQAAYAELALAQGQRERAIEWAERAVNAAQASGSLFSEGLAQRVWGKALEASDPTASDNHLAASLALFEKGGAHIEAECTRVQWKRIA